MTIKEWLEPRVRTLGTTWVDYLEDVLQKYNRKVHSATGVAPDEMSKEKEAEAKDEMHEKATFDRKLVQLKVGGRVKIYS